jgi:hypothetical protein
MRADPLARGCVRSMVCLFQISIPQPWGGIDHKNVEISDKLNISRIRIQNISSKQKKDNIKDNDLSMISR